jgi:hypothetical protein
MKPFTTIAVVVLGLVSAGQLIRFVQGWEVLVNGIAIPTWASAVAGLVAGGLAIMLWRESRTQG